MVEQQPIGSRLFQLFCEQIDLAKHSLAFYEAVVSFLWDFYLFVVNEIVLSQLLLTYLSG